MGKKKIEYINVPEYFRNDINYSAFVGGRATGKTYSVLRYCIESGKKFIYMRRTLDELEECCDNPKYGEGENPFKSLNSDFGWNYGLVKLTKKSAGIFDRDIGDDNKITHVGECLGYGLSLSTVATMRGIDLSDSEFLFYDEFIPEQHVRKIKAEGEAFLNAIETISRNREIKGLKPMKVVLCANAFNIYNEIFKELGVISAVEKMVNRGQQHSYMTDRGLSIHLLKATRSFVEAKSQTSLYRLTNGTNFYDLALGNQFVYNDFSLIEYKTLKGYQPVCSIDNVYIYRKKGSNSYYCSYSQSRCEHFNLKHVQERTSFFAKYGKALRLYFTESLVSFESYDVKMTFLDAIGIK